MTLTIVLAASGAMAVPAQAERAIIGSYDFPALDPCGPFYCPQDSPGSFHRATATAINAFGTGGAGAGDLFVAEVGGNSDTFISVGARIQQFSFDGGFKRLWGADVVKTGPDNADEVQAIQVSASGGSFSLSFGGETTAALPYNVSPGALETAIDGLGAAVNVTGGPGGPAGVDPYLVTFIGPSANVDQPLLKVDGASLAGGALAYTTRAGGTGFEICSPEEGDVCKRAADGFEPSKMLGGSINSVSDVAIDQASGRVYVAGWRRVNEFSANGDFLRAWGNDVVFAGPGDSDVDQQFSVTVKATSGSFTLTAFAVPPLAQTTANISYDATAATVAARLNELSSIGGRGGHVTVTGGPGDGAGSNPYTITFEGALGGDAIPLSGSGDALAGTLSVQEKTRGGAFEICDGADACQAGHQTNGVSADGNTVSVVPSGAPNAGNVLVAATHSVQEFNPAGQFVRMIGWNVDATEPGGGLEVCTAASGHDCTEGEPGATLGHIGQGDPLRGLAVDSEGAIYVAENLKGGRVQKLTPSGGAFIPSLFGSSESQSVKVKATAGQFRLGSFEPEGTVGTGVVTEGSPVVTNLKTSEGQFVVGQPITVFYGGGSLEEQDKVTVVAVSPSSLTLSVPAGQMFASGEVATLTSNRLVTTQDLAATASAAQLESALNALPTVNQDGGSVSVSGGPGDATGSTPYAVEFDGGPLAHTDPPQLIGLPATTPLSGGSGAGANSAIVSTPVPGGPSGIAKSSRPLDVEVGPGDEVLVAKQYSSGAAPCAGSGTFAGAETRIQALSPQGAVVDTSAPCTPAPQEESATSGIPTITANQATGNPYLTVQVEGRKSHAYVYGPRGQAPEINLDSPTEIGSTGGTITGTVDPNGPGTGFPPSSDTTYRVEYKKSSESSWTRYATDTSVGPGEDPVPISVGVNGLAPKTGYDVKVVVVKPFTSTVEAQTSFTTEGAPPAISALSTSNVGLSSADLRAKINPQGTATSYHFEYGTTPAYGGSTPERQIGDSLESVDVGDHIEGLQDATYHFRVVAINELGTTVSPDQTFTFHPPVCPNQTVRQQTNAAYLPDCRAYELVSPENANGTVLYTGGPQNAYATSPSRLAFAGQFGEIPGAGRTPINTTGDLYVATRGSTGWATRYVGPSSQEAGCVGGRPITSGTGLATTIQNDVMASPDLGRIIDWNLGNPVECVFGAYGAISSSDSNTAAEGSNAPYVWSANGDSLGRWPTNLEQMPGAKENFACPQDPNRYPYPEGFRGNIPVPYFCTTFVSASGDLNHFVFSTASGVFGEGGITSAPGSAYDNDTANGTTKLISLQPNGEPIEQEQPRNGGPGELIQFPHISADGSHILMGTAVKEQCKQISYPASATSGTICPVINQPTHLYMRVDDAISYDVSAGKAVHYVGSTADGSKVYFTTSGQLTADDGDQSSDLYLWDEHASPHLRRVSVGTGPTGNSDACSSTWAPRCGVEPYDDSAISKVIGNKGGLGGWSNLDPNPGYTDNSIAEKSGDIYFYSPEQLDNGKGIPGAENLYLDRDGKLRFIAALKDDPYCLAEGEEAFFPARKEGCSNGALGRLQVTPTGRFAAFITTTRLSEYDNHGFAEMYRYDADTEELRCVSCHLDGSPPSSDVLGSMGGRFITEDGRVFFDTEDALVARDTNEALDTYEYVEGLPQLITTGTGQGGSGIGFTSESVPGLYGVSNDGTDVYFGTFETLTSQDHNGSQLKFYDARAGGGFSSNPSPQPCAAADECHGSLSTPPASLAGGTGAALTGGNVASRTRKKRAPGRKAHRHKRKHDRSNRKHKAHAQVKRGAS